VGDPTALKKNTSLAKPHNNRDSEPVLEEEGLKTKEKRKLHSEKEARTVETDGQGKTS